MEFTEIQQTAYQAVEDFLIEMRDSRIGLLNVANGVVVREQDGSESHIVRLTTRMATDIAIEEAFKQVSAIIETYVNEDGDIEPEDGWRLVRDLRAALNRGEES